VIALVVLALGVPGASADTGDIISPQSTPPQSTDGWQAGTCTSDTPVCSVDTPDQFFKQSAGHPQVGFTQFIIKHDGSGIPVGNLKTVRVDLPVGLSVNPQATPQCDLAPGQSPTSPPCPATSKVGTSTVTAVNPTTGFSLTLPSADVFNLVPKDGEPARFGLSILGNDVYLEAGIAWEGDYHEYFTIDVAKLSLPDPGLGDALHLGDLARIYKNRLVFDGRAGDGTFITTPSTCYDPNTPPYQHVYSTFLRADSYETPDPAFPDGSSPFESPIPPGQMPVGCDQVDLEGSSIGADPGTAQTDSPSGASVNVDVPFVTGGANVAKSNLKDATVTLPPGMGLNPAAANGLEACTDAQFGKGTRNPVACPDASKIGTVSIQTPPLPPDSLAGNVYLGQPLSSDPASGQEFRIFVDAESTRYAISARLVGNVSADPQTGRLTTTFSDNPQVPFSSFQLHFDGGPKAPLISPPTCGPHTISSELTPWSGNPASTPSSNFDLTSAPDGGPCAKTLGERPFAPSFDAASLDKQGGAFTDFTVNLARPDGAQEVKGVNVDLPPGLVAKLAGVAYCPEAAIAAAATNSGAAEKAAPSCPEQSFVGTVGIDAGAGSQPLHIEGRSYLAGPYNGAPLSLVFITPAVAGPYDLGAVVVRVALSLDPDTGQVHAVSDPIPDVFGGVKLDLRSIAVHVSRKQFTLNPTNCDPKTVDGTLFGGGADPADPAAFFADPVSAPFQTTGCESLPFGPKLYLRLFGHRKDFRRNGHPRLRAVVVARDGDANISDAVTTLPQGILLDQSHIRTVCTRNQFATHTCPPDSVYGYATAYTPLLDQPLSGPVYLRPGTHALPDLVAALHGQVDFNLVGHTDTTPRGQLRSTFDSVPDVPVSKFVLWLQGGRKGLLVPSTDLCARPFKVGESFGAQNGKTSSRRPNLRVACTSSHRRSQRKHHRHTKRHH
jgi:hypothetical protein